MFAFIGSLFMIGTLSFWIIFIFLFILVSWMVDDDNYFILPAVLLSSFIFLVAYNSRDSIFIEFLKNITWLQISLFVLCYFILGIVWSYIKFYSKSRMLGSEIAHIKKRYLDSTKKHGAASNDKEFQSMLRNDLSNSDYSFVKNGLTKERILIWMSYWPFSMVWTLFNDPLRRAYNYVYTIFFIDVFKKIRNKYIEPHIKL